jgi:hypothetical protein
MEAATTGVAARAWAMSVSKSTTARLIVAHLGQGPSFLAHFDELSLLPGITSGLGCRVMRWLSVVFVGAAALGLAGLHGCGGKVVIDAEGTGGDGGNGGSNSSVSGSTGTSNNSTGSGSSSCMEGTCTGTPDGSCDCSGTCGGKSVKATCFAAGGTSFSCSCTVSGASVGKCDAPAGTFACDVNVGCCAAFFP